MKIFGSGDQKKSSSRSEAAQSPKSDTAKVQKKTGSNPSSKGSSDKRIRICVLPPSEGAMSEEVRRRAALNQTAIGRLLLLEEEIDDLEDLLRSLGG